jgi:hypothetical protein
LKFVFYAFSIIGLYTPESQNTFPFRLTGANEPIIDAGADINCNQGEVTFNVNGKEHMIYFSKKIDRKYGLNSIKNIETIKVGEIYCSRLKPKEEYKIVMVRTTPIKVEVT